jgi:hypothetical protein
MRYGRELDADEIEARYFEELDEFTARDLEPLSGAEELFTRCKGWYVVFRHLLSCHADYISVRGVTLGVTLRL